MSKIGYILIISGIITVTSYSLYIAMMDLEIPLIIKLSISLVVIGSILILSKQVSNLKKEKIEEEKYKDY